MFDRLGYNWCGMCRDKNNLLRKAKISDFSEWEIVYCQIERKKDNFLDVCPVIVTDTDFIIYGSENSLNFSVDLSKMWILNQLLPNHKADYAEYILMWCRNQKKSIFNSLKYETEEPMHKRRQKAMETASQFSEVELKALEIIKSFKENGLEN